MAGVGVGTRTLPQRAVEGEESESVAGTRALETYQWMPGAHPWREAGPPNHHDDKVDSDQ